MLSFKNLWSKKPAGLYPEYNAMRTPKDRTFICHAPFKSLYFAQDGKVRPCCFNNTYAYGNVGSQGLHQIWKDEKIQTFRKSIQNEDLSLGCYVCEQKLNSGQTSSVGALNYDNLSPSSSLPSLLEFECDNTCNLECVMCSGTFSSAIRVNREHQKLKPTPFGDNFVKQLEPLLGNLIDARFNGGEPFMSPLYRKIWDTLGRLNPTCTISVQTNGTVYNDSVAMYLQNNRFNISVSLDALDKEIYEKIRVNASFEKVMAHINVFRDYCHSRNTYFGLSVCPMRVNWKEMPTLVRFANENGAHISFHTVWYPLSMSLWNLDSTTLTHIHSYLDRFKWPANNDLEKKNIEAYRTLISQIDTWKQQAISFEALNVQQYSMKELTQKVLQGIKTWMGNQKYSEADTQVLISKYEGIIGESLASFVDEERILCLQEIMKIPSGLIVSVIETEEVGFLTRNMVALIKEKNI